MGYTIKDIFGYRGLRNTLYVVHDATLLVVYVGMARIQCVCDRMARHIGDVFAKENPSKFSRLLYRNHPQYFEWSIDVLSKTDAEAITGQTYDCLPCAERGLYDYYCKQQSGDIPGNAKRPSHGCEGAT